MWRPWLRVADAEAPAARGPGGASPATSALVVRAMPVTLRKASTARAVRASKRPRRPTT